MVHVDSVIFEKHFENVELDAEYGWGQDSPPAVAMKKRIQQYVTRIAPMREEQFTSMVVLDPK